MFGCDLATASITVTGSAKPGSVLAGGPGAATVILAGDVWMTAYGIPVVSGAGWSLTSTATLHVPTVLTCASDGTTTAIVVSAAKTLDSIAAALNATACEAERLAACPNSQAVLAGLAGGTASSGSGVTQVIYGGDLGID